jgi:esterase/lipase
MTEFESPQEQSGANEPEYILRPALDSLPEEDSDPMQLERDLFADAANELLSLPPIERAQLEDPEVANALKEGVQETAEKLIGEGAGISWHARSPQTIARADLFERFKKPFVLPGTQEEAGLLYIGGLTSSGYPWRDFACKIFERSGYHSEVYPLAGHDGTWKGLRDTGEEGWIKEIKKRADAFEKPPIIFCFSTSMLAACVIEKRHPGTFRAIVGVGGPFSLHNNKLESYLDRGQVVDNIFRTMTFGTFTPLWYGSVPMESAGSEHTHEARRSPGYSKLPLPTALSLRRLQKKAADTLQEITVPFFYAQGEDDRVISADIPDMVRDTLASEHKTIRTYPEANHGPMLTKSRYKLLGDICTFLKETLQRESPDAEIPDFKKRLTPPSAAEVVQPASRTPNLR